MDSYDSFVYIVILLKHVSVITEGNSLEICVMFIYCTEEELNGENALIAFCTQISYEAPITICICALYI